MAQFFLQYKNSVISYYRYGNSAKVLLCLHGYGEDGSSFSFLEDAIVSVYTFYAVDLPFHGDTQWKESEPFTAEDLSVIFRQISSTQKKYAVLGYSLGGRMALYLLKKYAADIERVVLIAPDGLHVNFWYYMATQTLVGGMIFKATIKHAQWFLWLLFLAGKTKLLNKSALKFIHNYVDEEGERTLLYKRWMALRKFKPDLKKIKNEVENNSVRLRFLFGLYDNIILSKRALMFERCNQTEIKIVKAGHSLLNEKNTGHIVSLLCD